MNYGGFFYIVDEVERASIIDEMIESNQVFSDTVSSSDWGHKATEILLISTDMTSIKYIGLSKRGNKVATRKYAVRFTQVYSFEEISISEIEASLASKLRPYFIKSSNGDGSRIPPKTWEAILEYIIKVRPEIRNYYKVLVSLMQPKKRSFSANESVNLAQEKDAVNIAMRIAGINPEHILGSYSSAEAIPYLKGIGFSVLREDQMINHDTNIFGDWSLINRHQIAGNTFYYNGEYLTIMNVNRTNIEETLGVDLIYYSSKYESYTMVQYKRLTGDEQTYRANDKSYITELNKMNSFQASNNSSTHNKLEHYRLNPGMFYFKLCPSLVFNTMSYEMQKGMYIPLDYWNSLVKSPQVRGKRGGLNINYSTAQRFINNSLFIELVQSGWIGSSLAKTSEVTKLINNLLNAKRSVMLVSKQSIST